MSMRRRLCLERLESRDNPSNFTVNFSGVTHTLTITGDNLNNNLTVTGVGGDATKFSLSSATDTFNNNPGPLVTPSGVKNIAIVLRDGDDAVTFTNTVPIDLLGNLSIRGGNGATNVTATDMKVEHNVTILNGTNTSGTDVTNLYNPNIGGRLLINNGAGNTNTNVYRTSPGLSTIGGNASVTNGTGFDDTQFFDINFGGNVTISNGHANASGNTGHSWIYNFSNTGARSVVKGNVTVSNLDGNVTSYDGIWDTEVLGNVTFNHGAGSVTTYFDAYQTTLPVVIRGSLTMTGTGSNTVKVGTPEYNQTGLIVGKNLTVTTGGAADALTFNKLEVGGNTRLTLGNGNNTLTIDDSVFTGTFLLMTGTGGDTVNLDHTAGTTASTTFSRAVLLFLGAGDDAVVRAGGGDGNQLLVVLDTFIIHHGSGAGDSTTSTVGHELFPFGTSIQYVV